jgi:hypothetical protein
MALLAADFKADLLMMARQYLEERRLSENIPDTDVLPKYFDSLRRWPAARPRRVWEADEFLCPPELTKGWEVLRNKVLKGEDLRPHLAREHSDLTHLDGLLNEWGIHHLHLGVKPYFKDSSFVDRTKQLLFALTTDDDFYAINVYPQHGDWETTEILESLHRNWPQVLARYRIHRVPGENVGKEERKNLRNANVQTFTAVSDGTVYAPIRGGVASSGVSIEAVMRTARAVADMKRLQIAMQKQIEKFIIQLRPLGYSDGQGIKATLVAVDSLGYHVLFPEFGLGANVKLEQEV